MTPNSFIFALDKEKGCWTKYQFFYMIYGAVLGFGVYMTCFVIVSINFIRAMVALKERRSFHQSVLSKKGKQIKIIFVSLLAIYVCFSTPLAIKLLLRASGLLDATQDLMMSHITLTISLLTTITDPCIYIFSWSGFHNGLRKQISNGIPRQWSTTCSSTVQKSSNPGKSSADFLNCLSSLVLVSSRDIFSQLT